MPTRSLTVAGVARIKAPASGQLDYFDAGYPGLALRVSYGGAKAWVFFHRLHGKLRRLSLGRYPGMSLVEAREAWRAARLAVSKGESPAHIRPTTADSFAAVAEEWLHRDQAQNRSAAKVRRAIERDVTPVWGERLIGAINRRDVIDLLDVVADRGAPGMALRLHAHLHRLFRWAVGRGIIEANPMSDLPRSGQAVKRDRVLDNSELATVWKAADRIGWPFGPAVRLLILSAARREEVGALRWSEIHGDEIRLPGERSKSGEPRTIPLSATAAKVIEALPRTGDHVFTTNGTTAISGWSKAKRALDVAAAEIHGRPLMPWRLHDLRRTAATGMQRLGVGLQTVEVVLGHVGSRGGIAGIYQRHQFGSEAHAALEAWAREVERITGSSTADSSTADSSTGSGNLVFEPPTAQLVLSATAPTVTVVDPEWLAAITLADETTSPEPLLDYFHRQPDAQLGPAEIVLLQQLLQHVNFTRKDRGRFTPVGKESRAQINETGAAYVRKLRQQAAARGEKLSVEAAIDITAKTFPPDWFGVYKRADGKEVDRSLALAAHIKRGGQQH